MAAVTDEQTRARINRMLDTGRPVKEIAADCGVTDNTVYRARHMRARKIEDLTLALNETRALLEASSQAMELLYLHHPIAEARIAGIRAKVLEMVTEGECATRRAMADDAIESLADILEQDIPKRDNSIQEELCVEPT